MANPVAVTNTSPIIALASIGELRLLDALFDRIVVPFEVWNELADKPGADEPAELRALRGVAFHPAQPVPPQAASLDAGERAAVALAVSLGGATLLLDELDARKIAAELRLTVTGTLGVLVEGKRRGSLRAVRPLIEALIANGFHLAPKLAAAVLSSVGE